MIKRCPGYPPGKSLNPPAHKGGFCCWACDHGWDDADCTCSEEADDDLGVPVGGRMGF